MEYVGRIPRNPKKKELVTHYIWYKSLMGEWLRNDDNLAHIAHVDGEYKVNMIFYRAMINAPEAVFYVETSGLTEWRKSVVIRGVYNERGHGGKHGHDRGRASTARATKVNETEETYLPDDSSSSESETNAGNYDV